MTTSEIYQEMQKEWVKLTRVKVGSTVEVTRDWIQNEQGFRLDPVNCVGQKMRVSRIDPNYIELNSGSGFPYYVLSAIEPTQEVRLAGSSPRNVEVEGKNIKCGCCNLTFVEAKKAIKAFETLSETFSKYTFKIVVEGTDITRENITALQAIVG